MYRVARPILFGLGAESAHRLALRAASWVSARPVLCRWVESRNGLPSDARPDPRLEVHAFGFRFAHPLGLAAGLDKDGDAVDLWPALGFAFCEFGTVTPGRGQRGNIGLRLERIVEDRAIVNRMGFNNRGATHLANRLAVRRTSVPCGANLGKAKETALDDAAGDYARALSAVWSRADYVVVNVSSPNTPGLRDLQAIASLRPLLIRVLEDNRRLSETYEKPERPVLLKVAPDLADEDVDRMADLALDLGLAGLIATNTTVRRDTLSRPSRIEGGVSGAPLSARAEAVVRRLYRRVGHDLPLVGVGGIRDADDAYRRVRAGASLLQLYTSLVYEGPSVVHRIVMGLRDRLVEDGYDGIGHAVGIDA